jgi:hypothetical protein
MSYKAIYAYPWDLAEIGVPEAVAQFRGLGLDTVTIAGSYHAGKFLRPHGATGKIYFPEDGTVYFLPNESRYGAIKPTVSRVAGERDVLRELCKCGAIAVNVWLVLLHNTRLGETQATSCVTNAFGDPYVYSLCPAAPAARAYALDLCRDVTESYPVRGISLETPGFLPYAHGFHHEFALIRWNRWIESGLGLCFCRHCLEGAAQAGIDAAALKQRVRDDIESYLSGEIDLPDDMAEAFWLADTRTDGELGAYLRWRCDVVTALVRDIRAAVRGDATVAVIPSVARPTAGAWYEGSDLRALAQAAGLIEACFYEPGPARVAADLWDVRRRLRGTGALRGILRPGYPDLDSREAVIAAVAALRRGGVEEIAFYNYGHLRQRSLDWIAAALA